MTDRTIMLTPGMLIAQLMVQRLSSPVEHPYGSSRASSRYQGQRGPTPSRSHLKGGQPCQEHTRSSPSSSSANSATTASPPAGLRPGTQRWTTP
jgi:hypothetical protein